MFGQWYYALDSLPWDHDCFLCHFLKQRDQQESLSKWLGHPLRASTRQTRPYSCPLNVYHFVSRQSGAGRFLLHKRHLRSVVTVQSSYILEQKRSSLLSNTELNIPDAVYKQPRSLIKHFQRRDPLAYRLNHTVAATKDHIVGVWHHHVIAIILDVWGGDHRFAA